MYQRLSVITVKSPCGKVSCGKLFYGGKSHGKVSGHVQTHMQLHRQAERRCLSVTFELSELSYFTELLYNKLKINDKKFPVHIYHFLVPRTIHITYIHLNDNNSSDTLGKYSTPFLFNLVICCCTASQRWYAAEY